MTESSAPSRFAVIKPDQRADIGDALLEYLRDVTSLPGLAFADAPSAMLGGFDTAIYAFSLDGAPPPLDGQLVARVFRTRDEAARADHEARIQNAVEAMGYPAPEVAVVEVDDTALGAPFIIMRRLTGVTMMSQMIGPRIARMASLLGHAHARLHALDADEFRRRAGDDAIDGRFASPEAWLIECAATIDRCGLDGLRPGMAWLTAHRPNDTSGSAVCHGDFHPLNVLVRNNELAGVVDWAWSGVGPAEYDVGAAIALLEHGPVALPRPLLPIVRVARRWIARRYLRAYTSTRSLNLDSVRYFETQRLFQFLCEAAEQTQAAAGVIASDMDSPFFAPDVRSGVLARFRAHTRSDVQLPPVPPA